MGKPLTPKQQKFVAALVAGKTGVDAAIAAGYPAKSAKNAAYQLTHDNQAVRAELARIAASLSQEADYNAQKAVVELDEKIAVAEGVKQLSAVAKLLELKMRVFGLLRDKLDITVERVDINGALTDARNRVSLRPMRDLPITIDAEPVGAQAPQLVGPIDTQSTAPVLEAMQAYPVTYKSMAARFKHEEQQALRRQGVIPDEEIYE
ncbi:terminase small subunit [Luteibacter sp.]|uniref:terminase small subunit n=1 Tax=Luteibacter sp. TaxID=1886636 RepID=UPI003F7EDD39